MKIFFSYALIFYAGHLSGHAGKSELAFIGFCIFSFTGAGLYFLSIAEKDKAEKDKAEKDKAEKDKAG